MRFWFRLGPGWGVSMPWYLLLPAALAWLLGALLVGSVWLIAVVLREAVLALQRRQQAKQRQGGGSGGSGQPGVGMPGVRAWQGSLRR